MIYVECICSVAGLVAALLGQWVWAALCWQVAYLIAVAPRFFPTETTFWYREPGRWYFRVFGWGLYWQSISRHGLIFSKRQSGLKVGDWYFKILWRREFIERRYPVETLNAHPSSGAERSC